MSDNLYENENGEVSMAYRGAIPWHGKGQTILDTDTFDDIIKKSGFDFEILDAPAGYMAQDGTFRPHAKRVVLYRNDTGEPLSVVSGRYKVHQPSEIMGFFRDFASTHGFKLETAGVLGRGAKYWALARTPIDGDAGNGIKDAHNLYALLATACDGSLMTRALATSVRVVCQNTLSMAVMGQDGTKQSHRQAFSPEEAAEGMGFSIEQEAKSFGKMISTLRDLNKRTVGEAEATQWFYDLLRPPKKTEKLPEGVLEAAEFEAAMGSPRELVAVAREPRGLQSLLQAYTDAPGARPGTARGLLEASTFYVDHLRGSNPDARLDSAWFSQGASFKERAWDAAVALL